MLIHSFCVSQEKKLKQEERVLLFEKLSYVPGDPTRALLLTHSIRKSQAQLPTTLQLQSSSTLGTGKTITHKDLLDKQEDKEVRKAMDGRAGKGKRRRRNLTSSAVYDSDDDDDTDGDRHMRVDIDDVQIEERADPHEEEGMSRARPVVVVDSGFATTVLPAEETVATPLTSIVGSALQRNSDGSVVAPRIVKRKPKRVKVTLYHL